MSIMLQGILRLPTQLWNDNSVMDKVQRQSAYIEAADKLLLFSSIEKNHWTVKFIPKGEFQSQWKIYDGGEEVGRGGYTLEVAIKNAISDLENSCPLTRKS